MPYNPTKPSWMNPDIEYLFNEEIIEYDIRDAGFTIIQYYQLLPEDEIKRLKQMEKMERHIAIGRLQGKDKELSKSLSDKFAEMRMFFVSANGLVDNRILSVKKDAIYTIGTCNKLKFGKIEFIPKNRYTSYIRFSDNMNIEIYYNSETMDIKGIGEGGINRHRLYILDFIKRVISYMESKDPSLKRFLKSFIDKYKTSVLDDAYYIEFNNMSRDYNPVFNFQKVIVPIVQISLKEISSS